ncbi:DUF1996 domain-containing protein [Actinomadura sp. NPDC048394]|uniref:DUF1996 domain-containing protein n=1 Tax=Actinomadura sp. NPDC048394 TaxID=3158223 RepID=UPI0033E5C4D0
MEEPMGHARRPLSVLRSLALVAGGGLAVASLAAVGVAPAGASTPTASRAQTITCPTVADRLPAVPAQAKAEVDRNLAQLDTQIKEANARLTSSAGQGGPNFVQNAILGPLKDKRVATINRIATAIGRVAQRPAGLDALAPCTLTGAGDAGGGGGGQAGGGQQATANPTAADFIDIRQVPRSAGGVKATRRGSRGTFTSRCGRNQNGHHNSANFIVAPGVENGAHHIHDYVGNLSTDAFSTDGSLSRAGTTCSNGDKSTYYWPVVRLRSAADSAQNDSSAADLNIGRVLVPATVSIQYRGNARSKVTAMPRFLRAVTGDAKSLTNGTANARAHWTCTGFTDRVTADKYPICPSGSRVTRVLDFPSCWDGQNTDSANHRAHIVFPDAAGACPSGTKAVPQLRMTLSYTIKVSKAQIAKGTLYALDTFPEQLHKPITDHGDFENVMSSRLMRKAVTCINTGRRC